MICGQIPYFQQNTQEETRQILEQGPSTTSIHQVNAIELYRDTNLRWHA